jgi:hypothetical protein
MRELLAAAYMQTQWLVTPFASAATPTTSSLRTTTTTSTSTSTFHSSISYGSSTSSSNSQRHPPSNSQSTSSTITTTETHASVTSQIEEKPKQVAETGKSLLTKKGKKRLTPEDLEIRNRHRKALNVSSALTLCF